MAPILVEERIREAKGDRSTLNLESQGVYDVSPEFIELGHEFSSESFIELGYRIRPEYRGSTDSTDNINWETEKEGLPRLSYQQIKDLLEEAEELLEEDDIIQASEKFYKVVEEIIKKLAEKYAPEYSSEANKKGRWTTTLLEKTVNTLTGKLGEVVHRAWSDGWDLHVKGFHEHFLDKESVIRYSRSIKELFERYAREEDL